MVSVTRAAIEAAAAGQPPGFRAAVQGAARLERGGVVWFDAAAYRVIQDAWPTAPAPVRSKPGLGDIMAAVARQQKVPPLGLGDINAAAPPPPLGLGDIIAAVAQPLAKAVDVVAGTNLQECQPCKRRREALNALGAKVGMSAGQTPIQ